MDLDRVKEVKRRVGGTVNDVVLATVVGALRRFLPSRGVRTDDLDFRALIPVSVRAQSERGSLGNKVAQMIAVLPLDERDPRRRLERVTATTTQLKRSHQSRRAS
jgi:GGDEF domain-containing protein